MFKDYPPDRENTGGARWNPPDCPAIYAAQERATVEAEVKHQLSLSPVNPSANRRIYTLNIALSKVIDLRTKETLQQLGLSEEQLISDDHRACQTIGGAIAFLENDGLLVPSVRCDGTNLVIYAANQDHFAEFEVVKFEDVTGT